MCVSEVSAGIVVENVSDSVSCMLFVLLLRHNSTLFSQRSHPLHLYRATVNFLALDRRKQRSRKAPVKWSGDGLLMALMWCWPGVLLVFGLAWFGLGLALLGLARSGVVWSGLVWYDSVWSS